MFCVMDMKIYFSIKWEIFWLLSHTVCFQSKLKGSRICDTITSFQSCHGNSCNIFLLHVCTNADYLKPVLGISYWTVCIDVFFSDRHCLYILVVMVMALTLCNENEMQTVKIFCGLVKLYLNLIFFFIHFSYTYP